MNLVRHSSTTASISTTTPTPFHTLRQDPPGMPPYADLIPGYAAGPAYGQQQQPPPIPGYQGYQRRSLAASCISSRADTVNSSSDCIHIYQRLVCAPHSIFPEPCRQHRTIAG